MLNPYNIRFYLVKAGRPVFTKINIKMKTRFFIIIVYVLGLTSCQVKTQHHNTQVELIPIRWDDLEEKDMFFSNNRIDSCRFIQLETRPECFIGEVKKVHISGGRIFVSDYNNKLFVFDSDGRFLNTIGAIGPGPGEMLSFIDFYVNEDAGYVGIFDILRMKVCRYSFDGFFIGCFDCASSLTNLSYIQSFDNGKLILSMANEINSHFNFAFINETDYSLDKLYLPYLAQGTHYREKGWKNQVASTGSDLYATAFLSDTIYCLSEDQPFPKFVWQTPLKKASSKIIDSHGPYEFGSDAFSFLRKNGYSTGLFEIFATSDYLHFTSTIDEKYYKIYWHLASGKGYRTLYREIQNIFEQIAYIATTTSDAFVCVIQAHQAVEDQQSEYSLDDPRVLEFMKNVHEEDNPILAFYYIKK